MFFTENLAARVLQRVEEFFQLLDIRAVMGEFQQFVDLVDQGSSGNAQSQVKVGHKNLVGAAGSAGGGDGCKVVAAEELLFEVVDQLLQFGDPTFACGQFLLQLGHVLLPPNQLIFLAFQLGFVTDHPLAALGELSL